MDDSAPPTNRTQHNTLHIVTRIVTFNLSILLPIPNPANERNEPNSHPPPLSLTWFAHWAGTGMGSMHIHYPAITTTATLGGTMSTETNGRTDGWTAKFDAILQYGTIVGSFFSSFGTNNASWLFLLFCAWARSSETDYPHSNWGLGWFGLLLLYVYCSKGPSRRMVLLRMCCVG